jgi:hypothetical protein
MNRRAKGFSPLITRIMPLCGKQKTGNKMDALAGCVKYANENLFLALLACFAGSLPDCLMVTRDFVIDRSKV